MAFSDTQLEVYLRTPRMVLRPLGLDDAPAIFEMEADPRVLQYSTTPAAGSIEHVREVTLPGLLTYHQHDARFGFFAAQDHRTGEFFGWFHLRPSNWLKTEMDLGYRLKQPVWNRGLATEGAGAVVDKAFREWQAKRVIAAAVEANVASIRVMEKIGMTRKKTFLYPGTNWRAAMYAISRRTWQQRAPV